MNMTDMIPAGMSDFTQVINYDESHEASMRGKEERAIWGRVRNLN